ncbi:hypothetical protein AB0425_21225 [Actinosynnema sp. NPDC051121]
MSDPLGAKIAENGDGESPPHRTPPERTRRPAAPGSLGFAAAVAVPCLVASLALGLGMIHVPRWFEDLPPTAGAQPDGTVSSWPQATTAFPTTTAVPAGYFRYTGPEGLSTVLPQSFSVTSGNDTGVVTARNTRDPDVEVRFGGAPPETYEGLYDTIAEAAAKTSTTRDGYRQHALERTYHGDLDAVEWDFQYDTAEGPTRRIRAHYWRTGGIEYVLLARAPPNRWTEATRLLDTMIDHSDTP